MADSQDPTTPPPPPGPPNQIPLGGGDGGKNLIPINIEDEMRRSYLDYAMSVIVGRALPDVRDGLKPVHRRILYGMHELGLHHNRPTRKCAKITGEVLGKYHPHGDIPVYDALVRMAQPFSLRYPLVDGQGNFGSVDGDPPAAMRYTEARLSRIAATMLEDIDKETVDFRPNYDETEVEPEVLPSRIPNLLINGSEGIAVGMASKIPPHNIKEIIDACVMLVQNPATTLAKVAEVVQGPDFPTGALILGREGIGEYFKSGRGTVKMRAKAAIEKLGKDREAIIVTEIPYQVNKARLVAHIAELVNDKRIEGISDVRDESDRDGYRVVLVISGHRGNDFAAMTGIEEAGYHADTHLLYMCYQDANRGRLAEVLGPEVLSHIRPDDQRYGADGHGGSIELSIAMAHAPGSVRMDKRKLPDRAAADTLRSFPFKAVLSIEEYAPTDGFFGDPSLCSEQLGQQIAERTADRIAAEVRRYLTKFPARAKRTA